MTSMTHLMMQEIKTMDLPIFTVTLQGAPHKSGYDARVTFRSFYPIETLGTHEETPEGAIKMLRDVLVEHISNSCPACGIAFKKKERT